ncbi:MAG TPA: hypothetical protein VIG29_03635, partial [Vicinamibacteria bacterium]
MVPTRRTGFALFFLLLSSPLSSQSRALHWNRLDVTARLDEEGRLHVVERHHMVFTGDWNGGERRFRLEGDHRLELNAIEREDLDRRSRIPLRENDDLSRVGDYAWTDSSTLRWRARLLSDPPFQNTDRVYVLDYTLENVLVPTGDGFLLDHDFAFPDRTGAILAFTLELRLADAWVPEDPVPERIERQNLPPGASVVIRVPLEYRGERLPSGVRMSAPLFLRRTLAIVFVLAAAGIGVLFLRAEAAIGRFAPLTDASEIDRDWLDKNLFTMRPEEVGAAWDDTTSAPEVAAVLARLVSEGKLKTEVYGTRGFLGSGQNLRMELLVPRSHFKDYESALVTALFVSGNVTDTVKIRTHYRKRGFDPASVIKEPLRKRVARFLHGPRSTRRSSRKPTLYLLLAAFLALGASIPFDQPGIFYVIPPLIAASIAYVVAMIPAAIYRKRVEKLFPFALTFLVPGSLVAAVVVALLLRDPWRNQ